MYAKALFSLAILPCLATAQRLGSRDVSCTFSIAANAGDTCNSFSESWTISVEQLKLLNPGLQCPDLEAGKNYCVDGKVTTAGPATSTLQPTTTTTTLITTTTPANGVETPQPTQPNMVGNCNLFHYISTGNTCDQITSYSHITQEQFARWNPEIGEQCHGLQANAYACVGVIGESSTPASTHTATTPSNGIQTPQPTQPDMVSNCNLFHYISKGDSCDQITSYSHITQEQFARWNPKIGMDCTGMWANAYACVGVIGEPSTASSTPTPTTPSNSIQTPQPTQPDMVSNCNLFHYISKGNSCDQITSYSHITQEQFARWNPKIGMDCSGMWADAYACVGVVQDTPPPTSTTPANAIQTPQPTQPGMVKGCKLFHYISKGNTCDQITSYSHITQEQFARWNPKIGIDCSGMWADAYACVGV